MAQILRKLDSLVVDSAMVGVGQSTRNFSEILKTMASGNAQHYGLIMATGILALLVLAISIR